MKRIRRNKKEIPPRGTNHRKSQSAKVSNISVSESAEGEKENCTIVNVGGRRVVVKKVKNISEYIANNRPAVQIEVPPTDKHTKRSGSSLFDYVVKIISKRDDEANANRK